MEVALERLPAGPIGGPLSGPQGPSVGCCRATFANLLKARAERQQQKVTMAFETARPPHNQAVLDATAKARQHAATHRVNDSPAFWQHIELQPTPYFALSSAEANACAINSTGGGVPIRQCLHLEEVGTQRQIIAPRAALVGMGRRHRSLP